MQSTPTASGPHCITHSPRPRAPSRSWRRTRDRLSPERMIWCLTVRNWAAAQFVSTTRKCNRRYSACRSEEHTSELQSRGHLVCRLLLEKKKDINPDDT